MSVKLYSCFGGLIVYELKITKSAACWQGAREVQLQRVIELRVDRSNCSRGPPFIGQGVTTMANTFITECEQ